MSQLQLFDYSTLSPDLQVEVKTATERIKLRMKRTAEDIIEIGKDLIAIKEKLPHGSFLPWIGSEFGLTDKTAQNFMNVAERFGSKNEIISDFKPTLLYLLAAPSTPDEVVEQVIEKAENGETVTAKEVKELKAQLQEKDRVISSFSEERNIYQRQLENVQKQLEIRVEAEAKELVQEIEAEYQGKIEKLEKDQLTLMDKLADAEESYHSALESFKKNPDPDTKKKCDELRVEYNQMIADIQQVKYKLEKLQRQEDYAVSASLHLERFFGDFNKLMSKHPDALTAMASPYLPDSSLAKIENLANTLEYWAETIQKSVYSARSAKANQIEAVDIEFAEVN
jgi:menaquinone-dependent protoporphyrinogen IX oxidase